AGGWHGARTPEDALADLQQKIDLLPPAPAPELPGFWSGAVGYFAYDAVRYIERLPHPPPRGVDAPDAMFIFPDAVVILDNFRSHARIVVPVAVPPDPSD